MTNQPQPGWYYAQGDPPGTHRYWDGGAWVGEPQLVNYGGPVAPATSARTPATIGSRFVAMLIDIAVILVPFIVLSGADAASTDGEGGVLGLLAVLAVLGLVVWNHIVKQGRTGQTVGKGVMNVALLSTDTYQPIGIGKAIGRYLLGGIINNFFAIGYIWALFDQNNQRLTDKILSANVFTSDQRA